MQSVHLLTLVISPLVFFLCLNFLYFNKDLMSSLLIIESWWIGVYFLLSFIITFSGLHVGGLLLPLILIFAGLEVVLGFYFLYYI